MAEFPALPFFTDAYLADTRHLTAAQHGGYILLLMSAWRSGDCSLPNDDTILAKWAAMDKRSWSANRDVIMSFWVLGENNKFTQKRLLDERKYVAHKRNVSSQAGKASALKRLNRGSTDVQRNVNENPTPTPTPTPTLKEKEPKGSKKKISFEDITLDHVSEWLTKKRVAGKYLTVDEDALLERFKDYCRASNPRYSDYVAAFRNSFDWNNTPKKGQDNGTHRKLPTKHDRLKSAADSALAEIYANIDREERESGVNLLPSPAEF